MRRLEAVPRFDFASRLNEHSTARRWIAELAVDLRHALRWLKREPVFAFAAVVCLGLGVGANSVMFGVVNALLFRPPAGVAAPGSVVRIRIASGDTRASSRSPVGRPITYPDFLAVSGHVPLFVGIAAYASQTVALTTPGEAEAVTAVFASGSYFAVLRPRARLGRFFGGAEDQAPGAGPVAVLSYDFWRRRFGADPAVLGRTLQVNGVPLTVIGVAGEGFAGVDPGTPALWLPLTMAGTPQLGGHSRLTRGAGWLRMVGRLRPGVERQHALHAPRPFIEGEDGSVIKLELAPPTLAAAVTAAANRPVPVWIVGITLTILLVTCATVANLLLARAARREREVATRLALGSSRERLVRQFLAEALLLALFATVSGLGMATVGARFAAMLPLPPLGSVLDHSTLAVTLGLALLTTLLAGLAPGIWAARRNFSAALAGGSGRVTGSRSRLRNTLIGMQVALSFALLLGAVLFVRSLRNVHATDVGFDLSHLLLVQPAFPPGRSATDVTEYADATRAGLTRLPGVISVAASSSVPYGAMLFMTIERPDPRPDEGPLTVDAARVTASYFSTMRIAINQGRAFDSRDRADGPPVVIVSESLARAAWPRQSPLGQCLRLFTAPRDGVCLRVIGIASDARYQGILEPPHPFMYLAAGQATPGLGDAATIPRVFLVRARDRPAAIAGAVRRVLMMVDPTLPPVEVRPIADLLRPQTVPWEVGSKLFTVFGILALVLAGVGLYVVVAFLVTEREREFAIRQALGADRRKVIGLLLQHGLRLTLAGIAGGATVGAAFSRFLSSRLYDVSPLDPTTYAAVALVMLVVALLACFIPARAAAGTDPMMALRAE